METARIEKDIIELAGKDEIAFLNSFFILFRTAQYTEPGNVTFQTQSSKFYINFRRLVDEHGVVSIKVIAGRILVRDRLVKLDSDGMVRARETTDRWRLVGIGGIVLDDSLDNRQIDKFACLVADIEKAGRNREDIIKSLSDLGIEGITLLAIEEKRKEPVVPEEKRIMMRRTARASFFRAITVVQNAMLKTANDEAFDFNQAKRVVHSLIDRISEDESMLLELTNIRDFDEYTYAHCANVCVYSLTMGIRLELDRQRLSQLGFAALFHDIGKVKLSEDLIRKPQIYDENDWIQIQKHPILGAKTILRNLEFNQHTARAAIVALEHHINVDNTGYPVLKRKRPLNLFSRIVSIADTFDALSSGRVYLTKKIPPDEVMRKMMYQITVRFDAFLLKLFIDIIGVYPVGTLILLSGNELGAVSRNNQNNLARPVVKLIGNRSGPYKEFIELDLSASENSDRQILRIIDPADYNVDIKSIILSDKTIRPS